MFETEKKILLDKFFGILFDGCMGTEMENDKRIFGIGQKSRCYFLCLRPPFCSQTLSAGGNFFL